MPSREPPERFPVSFYIVAMLFIMFDIEIVFLYPYAVERSALGVFGFWAIVGFSVIFFLTFVYEVARGGLDWGPLHELPQPRGRCRDGVARTRLPRPPSAGSVPRAASMSAPGERSTGEARVEEAAWDLSTMCSTTGSAG